MSHKFREHKNHPGEFDIKVDFETARMKKKNSIMCPGKEDKLIRGTPTQLNNLACQLVLITSSIIRKGQSEACEGSTVVRDESNSKFQLKKTFLRCSLG